MSLESTTRSSADSVLAWAARPIYRGNALWDVAAGGRRAARMKRLWRMKPDRHRKPRLYPGKRQTVNRRGYPFTQFQLGQLRPGDLRFRHINLDLRHLHSQCGCQVLNQPLQLLRKVTLQRRVPRQEISGQ